MDSGPDKLIFSESPTVTFASNRFKNVPIILQYDGTPLIEVIQIQQAGFTTRFTIYHSDGTDLAKVVGSQVHPTPAGKKAGVITEHRDLMTVCKLGTQTLFEIRRTEAAALKMDAELNTPDGRFIRFNDNPAFGLFDAGGAAISAGGVFLSGCYFEGCKIAIWMQSNGSTSIGVNG